MLQRLKNHYHLGRAVIATIQHGFPSRNLVIIGVTGTDGKTTTAKYIFNVLQESGKKAALISTISALIDEKEYQTGFHVTTPGSGAVQAYLKKAKKAGVTHVVLEVTSHALDQNRVFGIPFTIGVLTNISHEHLDYHKTMDHYVKTKFKLLRKAKIAVVNIDDESYQKVTNSKYKIDKRKIITYGLGKDANINPHVFAFQTKLPGKFNQYNALAAIAVGKTLSLSEEKIRKAISTTLPPKGRAEVLYKKDFTVMVDFAHTPNAVKNILQTVKDEIGGKGRIIHVFGSAGERDRSKRPAMGKTSAKFAEILILTAEDPRKETVEIINRAIRSGIDRKREVMEIPDRQEAISHAIAIAKKGDFVVITGKGHEQSMNVGHGEEPWSDQEAVLKALEKVNEVKR